MHGDKPGGPIRWRMHIPAGPDSVFDALDSDEGRASFWAETADEVDGVIQFRFSGGQSWDGKIRERARPHRFSVDYIGGIAIFELKSDGEGGTDLLLTQVGIEDEHWNEVHAGWLNVLFPLKAWIGFNVDLRNHDATRSWEQGYADQ